MAKANSSHAHAAPQLNESTPSPKRAMLGRPINESTSVRVLALKEQLTIEGQRYGRLVVLGPEFMVPLRANHSCRTIVVLCDCGNTFAYRASDIFYGVVQSCGCLRNQRTSQRMITHGLSRHPLFFVWRAMKNRCYLPSDKMYYCYGERGITVCSEWRDSFVRFYDWAMSNGWKSGLSIDRINNDGNYEPSNCRFATGFIQQNNTSRNRYINAFGEKKSAADWARDSRCRVTYAALMSRIRKGWNDHEAITTKPLGTYSNPKRNNQ